MESTTLKNVPSETSARKIIRIDSSGRVIMNNPKQILPMDDASGKVKYITSHKKLDLKQFKHFVELVKKNPTQENMTTSKGLQNENLSLRKEDDCTNKVSMAACTTTGKDM